MFYVQRNTEGQLTRVEAEAYAESTETLPADHPDLQDWFTSEVMATRLKQLQQIKQLKQLKQSDLEMIRVLDDLIQVLISKGVILVTDLPAPARAKLMDRTQAREALGGLSHLVDDDEDGLI
ncbi:tryptophan synthase subunit beta [Pseudomonas sp. ANT_H12B]|uniref:tryptophan synthase subunit beta n=1 Tax=Pseudomonas sp. ANT_H12B TaxID=2597348 RepID=UPI0011EE2FB3|nr:tryptophan synthase subunit beta [Pseudomonas sp. ANT_H12B]KAA0976621.1 tryptophan synthase subunit beta [Pseudomonas sp. ANT_H12B]